MELTTDIFILAAHFNNLIQNGIVVVNVESRNVQYHAKADTTILSLYPVVIYSLIKIILMYPKMLNGPLIK